MRFLSLFLFLVLQRAEAGCPFLRFHDTNDTMPNPHAAPSPGCSAKELQRIKSTGPPPDPGTTTVKGCTCTSNCGATVDFGQANCDWCYTADKCGSYSYSRFAYYDYCVYPKNATYEAQTWQWKENYLWSRITADPTHGSYPVIAGIVGESIQTTFDDQWDWMPAGRVKYIHSVGAVCKFGLNISPDSPYTGVFQPGYSRGLIRMGSALTVNPLFPPFGLVPGMGIKFLRSGQQSANFVVLHSLDAQDGWDFFSNNQSNHIAPPSLAQEVVAIKFAQASNCITQVGLSDAATYDQNGNKAESPNFPYQLIFVPTGAVHTSGTNVDTQLAQLEAIANGTDLFNIYAYESPADRNNPAIQPTKIAVLSTISECTQSAYGDASLFFRHQRMEEDWKIKPEWMADIEPGTECGASDINPTPPESCMVV